MKRSIIYLALGFLTIGCTNLEIDEVESSSVQFPDEYQAYTDSETQTKVFVNGSLKTLWNKDDRITIFNNTYNAQWKFTGETGADNGSFSKVSDEYYTGADIPTTYAVYPYNPSTSITEKGEITLTLPSVQLYADNSYGLGANTMIAATKTLGSDELHFKNLCSYVVIQLYGTGTVKSITLTGNNGEKLAGTATVKPVYGEAPSAVMSDAATTSITLDCGDGVVLGSTEGTATEFWFCIPPTTFSKGFTIKAVRTDGYFMEKVTSSEKVFERNTKYAMAAIEGVFDQFYVPFEDANFKAYCVQNFDKNGDGEISKDEALAVTAIVVDTKDISSLSGIEYFNNLESLDCSLEGSCGSIKNGTKYYYDREGNTITSQLTHLDVSKNTSLTFLRCSQNLLTSLDVSKNTALTQLDCGYNYINELDVSKNTALAQLDCGYNYINELDISKNTALTTLDCEGNQLTSLDVSNNTGLTDLICYSNQLTSLDVSHNTALKSLRCGINPLTSLDVSHNTALKSLGCNSNQLTALDVSKNTALTELYCDDNQLTTLDVSKNTALTYLDCDRNQLTSLDVSKNTALTTLDCQGNQLTTLDVSKNTALAMLFCCNTQLTALDISNNTALTYLYCYNNQLTTLDVSKNTALAMLDCHNNQLTALDISKNTALLFLKCFNNKLTTIYVWEGFDVSQYPYFEKDDSASFVVKTDTDYVPFEDDNFKAYCVQNFDKDGDGEISMEEAEKVQSITVDGADVKSLGGIEYFTKLWYLNCSLEYTYNGEDSDGNFHFYDSNFNEIYGQLINLDVSKNIALTELYCDGNKLTNLDLSKNISLTQLRCYGNQLKSLDVSKSIVLTYLNCGGYNQLTSLDVSKNSALTELYCDGNQLTSLDVSNNTALTTLCCHGNQFKSLDVSNNTALTILSCENNQLTTLDVSKNTALTYLDCEHNQLTSLDVSKNTALKELLCDNNKLTNLDVSKNTALARLDCYDNQLTSLDVSSNTALTWLYCDGNQLTSLDVSNNTALTWLWCADNQLATLNISMNTALSVLNCYNNQISTIYVWEGFDSSKLTMCLKDDSASFVVKTGE